MDYSPKTFAASRNRPEAREVKQRSLAINMANGFVDRRRTLKEQMRWAKRFIVTV